MANEHFIDESSSASEHEVEQVLEEEKSESSQVTLPLQRSYTHSLLEVLAQIVAPKLPIHLVQCQQFPVRTM
jgi:hypothetical protein